MTEPDEATPGWGHEDDLGDLLRRCLYVIYGLEKYSQPRLAAPVPIEGEWMVAAIGRAFAIYRSMYELARTERTHPAVGALARELALTWLSFSYLRQFGNQGAERMWRSNIRAMQSIGSDVGQPDLWAVEPPDPSWSRRALRSNDRLTPPTMFRKLMESLSLGEAEAGQLQSLWTSMYECESHFSAHPTYSAAVTHVFEKTAAFTAFDLLAQNGRETVRTSLANGTSLLLTMFEQFPTSPGMLACAAAVGDCCMGLAEWPEEVTSRVPQRRDAPDLDAAVLAEYRGVIRRTQAMFPIRAPLDAKSTWVEAANARTSVLAYGIWQLIAIGMPDLAGVLLRSQLEWVYALNYAVFGPPTEAGRALWRSSVAREASLPAHLHAQMSSATVPAHWTQPPIVDSDVLGTKKLLELAMEALRACGHDESAVQLDQSYRSAFRIASETTMHCTYLALETYLQRLPGGCAATTKAQVALPTAMFVHQSQLFLDGMHSILTQHREAEADSYALAREGTVP
jgi:hypothetical protein